jgi:hypothetical protein
MTAFFPRYRWDISVVHLENDHSSEIRTIERVLIQPGFFLIGLACLFQFRPSEDVGNERSGSKIVKHSMKNDRCEFC